MKTEEQARKEIIEFLDREGGWIHVAMNYCIWSIEEGAVIPKRDGTINFKHNRSRARTVLYFMSAIGLELNAFTAWEEVGGK